MHRPLACKRTRAFGSLCLFLASFVLPHAFVSASASESLHPDTESGLTIESALDIKIEWLENTTLGDQSRDDVRYSEQEIQLGLSFRRGDFLTFGEVNFIADQADFSDERSHQSEEALERGEMWVLFERIMDSRYSLQIGRQSFFEPRLWWWDDELDAVRVYYDQGPWSLFIGVAEELGRVSTEEDFIEPAQEDVRRLLAYARWMRTERFDLSGYLLVHRDHSNTPAVGNVVQSSREDDSDADLIWAGLRVAGVLGLSARGLLSYRADVGFVSGDETSIEFEDDAPGFSLVSGVDKHNVQGWAVDLGMTWTLPLGGDPTLTLIYAYGSGDADLDDGTDRAFRQTGLQDEDEDFRDYGVVLRPELSNLHVLTLALGLPVHGDTRLTLGYHRFRQAQLAPFTRDIAIDAEPTGESKDIGEELSLVLEIREWENLEIDVIAGSFEAGRAFGSEKGRHSDRLFMSLTYEF